MTLIRERVKSITKKHRSYCPFEIAKAKGIIVLYADLGETLGFYFCDSRIKFININQHLSEREQRIVCAHELGHAILHPKSNTPFMKKHTLLSVDKIEVEANTFAAHLLITDDILQDCYTEQMTMQAIASLHNVPIELVQLKCNKLFL